jgi:acyl transferase domain-containing protein/NAD(P)-dependent dehydrogenase (short-subunit alcohol dehydrogenase family)/acyl carrier protein
MATYGEKIAIIGMGCLVPSARNSTKFWENILAGVDPIIQTPNNRWDWSTFYHTKIGEKDKTNSKWGGFVEPYSYFKELLSQAGLRCYPSFSSAQRLLLEAAWQAIECSGYNLESLGNHHPIIIIGTDMVDNLFCSNNSPSLTLEYMLDNSEFMLAGFLSQLFNWKGINFAINCGQSSSLVAVHTACQYLSSGAADVALVGGVNIVGSPYASICFSSSGLQAKDGRCKSFSNQADGFVRSDGATAVVLKPLKSALKDKDNILCVIRSTAASQGVQLEKSRIMPSYDAQKNLLEQVIKLAQIYWDDLSLIETHGSGTFLGDSVEFKALQDAFNENTKKRGFCALGATKTNIGHTEATGGLIGLIKAILCLKHGYVPPNLHFNEPNINLFFEDSPFYWPDRARMIAKQPRLAGVSSFGLGGAIAHVIIENFNRRGSLVKVKNNFSILPISAISYEDLKSLIIEYLSYFDSILHNKIDISWKDICYTAALGREHFAVRIAIVASSIAESKEKLESIYNVTKDTKYPDIVKIAEKCNLYPSIEDGKSLANTAKMYMGGKRIDWLLYYKKGDHIKANLPTYPFYNSTFSSSTPTMSNLLIDFQENDIKSYLINLLAEYLHCSPDKINLSVPFSSLGIESLATVKLVRVLEEHLGVELPSTLFLDYPNLQSLLKVLMTKYQPHQREYKKEVAYGNYANNSRELTACCNNDIAIVGIALSLKSADNMDQYWEILANGIDTVTEIPIQRWDVFKYAKVDDLKSSNIYCKWGSFLPKIEFFDPLFFNISPKEAEYVDPQQKLLLELSYKALENSGYGRDISKEKAGVFIGASYNHYLDFLKEQSGNSFIGLGNSNAIIANRISYVLELTGPSLTVDTLCSSSLVALHNAVISLRLGECKMALVGAAHVGLSPSYYQRYCLLKALSPNGRCKTFDKRGDGFVPGEGGVVIVLKLLSTAKRDRDNILAVIKGSATNHGGQGSGLTVPSSKAQSELILDALQDSNIKVDTVSYIEAHGTGTELGDPIEVEGLTKAFGTHTDKKQFCAIGSAKTNIGHAEPAAGLVGVAKVILALQKKQLPPIVHLQEPNPHIDFVNSPFYINDRLASWGVSGNIPRRAGISAFGMGGTNAHVILEEAPPQELSQKLRCLPQRREVFTLSARDQSALKEYLQNMRQYIARLGSSKSLLDICYSANRGRKLYEHRIAVVADNLQNLQDKLFITDESRLETDVYMGYGQVGDVPKIAFLFTGQGSQYVGMGKQLYEEEPLFKEALDNCAEILKCHIDRSLLDILFKEERLVHQTQYTQPVLFALEYSLARLLESNGIVADYLLGHSLGEYVAACIAGCLSLEDALRLVSIRGSLMQSMAATGGMGVIFASLEEVQELLQPYAGQLVVSGINAPKNITISGSKTALESVSKLLGDKGIGFYPLQVSHAFHSPLIEGSLSKLGEAAANMEIKAPQRCLVSNLFGRPFQDGEIPDSKYWLKQTSSAVMFESGVKAIEQKGCQIFIEIGPQPTLVNLVQKILQVHKCCCLIPISKKGNNLPDVLAQLYVSSVKVNWRKYYEKFSPEYIPLVTYPFQKQYSWYRSPGNVTVGNLNKENKPLPGFYKLSWIKEDYFMTNVTQSWLVLTDTETLSHAVSEALGDKKHTYAWFGDSDEQVNENAYRVSAVYQSLYTLIVKHVAAHKCKNICLVLSEKGDIDPRALLETVYKTIQVLKQNALTDLFWLIIIESCNSHPNTRYLRQVHLLSLIKTLPYEGGCLSSAIVKVKDYFSARVCVDIISRCGLKGNIPKNLEATFQNEILLVENLEPIILPNDDATEEIIHANKVYLVIGGMGAIGKQVVSIMSHYDSIVVIIVGRSELNKKETSELQSLQNEANKDTKIIYFSADVAQKDSLNNLFKKVQAKYGNISGIIHVAGAIEPFTFVEEKSFEEFLSIGASKTIGTQLLWELCDQKSLDFFLFFSSYASLHGFLAAGFSGYAAANKFINEFTWLANEKKPKIVKTIIWPAWKNIGMMLKIGKKNISYPYEITMQEGISFLDKIFKKFALLPPVTIILGGSEDLSGNKFFTSYNENIYVTKRYNDNNYIGINNGHHDSVGTNMLNVGDLSLTDKSSTILNKILSVLSAILKIEKDKIPISAPISRLGVDSITLMQIINKLGSELGTTLKPTDLLEHPTAELFSAYLNKIILPQKIDNEADITLSGSSYAKNHLTTMDDCANNKIAVIGMSCILPGANSIDIFWDNLKAQRNFIQAFPEERIEMFATINKNMARAIKSARMKAGLISDIHSFNSEQFGLTSKETKVLDLQQKLFLKVAYQALKESDYLGRLESRNKIGVFVGARMLAHIPREYRDEECVSNEDQARQRLKLLGRSQNFISAWVSDRLNLSGPSLVIDTACSSSLVAIHLACQSLRNNECELALAGGIELLLDPYLLLLLKQSQALSPNYQCKTFDYTADGYVPGEGGGCLLLKPLAKAVQDKDRIYGVILGSLMNNDGNTMGYTTPNLEVQQELLINTYQLANVNPRDISYIELHGTGTAIGDPIELRALTQVFQKFSSDNGYCAVGSVKTNIGHLHSAAGVTSMIKVLLSLENKYLPATLNCHIPNPRLEFEATPFYPNAYNRSWECASGDRKAACSSFGFGGTNCHVIVEEAAKFSKHRSQSILLTTTHKKRVSSNPNEFVHNNNKSLTNHPLLSTCNIDDKKTIYFNHCFAYEDIIIRDHEVQGIRTLPGVTWLEMVRAAFASYYSDCHVISFTDVQFYSPLRVLVGQRKEVEGYIETEGKFVIKDKDNTYVSGILTYLKHLPPNFAESIKVKEISNKESGKEVYAKLRNLGYFHGPFFRNLLSVEAISEKEVIANLKKSRRTSSESCSFLLDPGILDSTTLLPFATSISDFVECAGRPFVPFTIEDLIVNIRCSITDSYFSTASIHSWNEETGRISVKICNDKGDIFVQAKNLTFKKVLPISKIIGGSKEEPQTKLHLFYHTAWDHKPILQNTDNSFSYYVLFFAPTDVIAKFKEVLNKDDRLIVVGDSDSYSEIGEKVFTIDARNAEHYISLFRKLDTLPFVPLNIIHAHALSCKKDTISLMLPAMESLFVLIQSMRQTYPARPYKLRVLGYQGQIETSGLWGMLSSVAREHPFWSCIGVEFDLNKEYKDNLAYHSINEFTHGEPFEVIRYTANNRCRRIIQTIPVERLGAPPKEQQPLPFGAVCVISGGLGALGLEVARYLAKKYGAKVALLSRSDLPSHSGWNALLRDTSTLSTLRNKLLALQEIEFLGGEVIIVKTDITNETQVKEALNTVRLKWGSIQAVFHLAGVTRDKLVVNSMLSDLHAVINPKLKGAFILDKLTQNDRLCCFVLFSSIVSIIGNLGQVCYAAANALLDAFAYYRASNNASLGFTKVINWSAWSNLGMVEDNLNTKLNLRDLQLKPLSTQIALEALDKALRLPDIQIIISEYNSRQDNVVKEANDSNNKRGEVMINDISQFIDWLQKEMSLPGGALQSDTQFLGLGLDSLRLVELSREIGEKLEIKLYPTIFFEYQTPVKFYNYLSENYPAIIAKFFSKGISADNFKEESLSSASNRSSDQDISKLISHLHSMVTSLRQEIEDLKR